MSRPSLCSVQIVNCQKVVVIVVVVVVVVVVAVAVVVVKLATPTMLKDDVLTLAVHTKSKVQHLKYPHYYS